MKPRWIFAVFGDLHVNDKAALLPPSVTLDNGGMYKSSKVQHFIWRHWLLYWSRVQAVSEQHPHAEVWGVCLGELADNNHHHSAAPGLVTLNPADQQKFAMLVMEPAMRRLDQLVVLRGTEAHSGPASAWDEELAQELGAFQHGDNYSTYHWMADFDGFTVDAAHHPGTGHARPWTRGADANRLAAMIKDDYVENDMLPPMHVWRGHNHRPGDSVDNHRTRVLMLPSWKLTDAYGYRLGSVAPLPIGGAIVLVEDRRTVEVEKVYTRWPMKQGVYRWSSPKTN